MVSKPLILGRSFLCLQANLKRGVGPGILNMEVEKTSRGENLSCRNEVKTSTQLKLPKNLAAGIRRVLACVDVFTSLRHDKSAFTWHVVGVSNRSLAGRKQPIVQEMQRTRTTLKLSRCAAPPVLLSALFFTDVLLRYSYYQTPNFMRLE
jgi:hypothetical protein